MLPLKIGVGSLLFVLGMWGIFGGGLEGARLKPDRRVVEVLEVDNGYLIRYRTANNPYPSKEAVAVNAVKASEQVYDYLKQPIPEPWWSR